LHKNKNKEQRASIIGKINKIETRLADREDNEYNIPVGTEYYVCHAAPLYRQAVFGQSAKRLSERK
jgi:hypothetical protein